MREWQDDRQGHACLFLSAHSFKGKGVNKKFTSTLHLFTANARESSSNLHSRLSPATTDHSLAKKAFAERRMQNAVAKLRSKQMGEIMANATQESINIGSYDSDFEPAGKLDREQLIRTLAELYELLEEYAPAWYTQKHHDIAAAALKAVRRN